MPSSGLFTPIFVPDALQAAVGDVAWLQAMLDTEGGLARAQARVGLIPAGAATAITAACDAARFDLDALGEASRAAGNPVVPLARALTEAVGGEAAGWVHWGATSQDVLDTAMVLVARRAVALALEDLDGVADACAGLAAAHRDTLMAGRTLGQQAGPTTFGLKAAGWLVAVLEAGRGLRAARDEALVVELGGATGTLASLDGDGLRVATALAEELGLAEPVVPWHASRGRIAALGAALAIAAGALGKVALDVELMAQTEVGEVAEPSGGGRGGSSAMPHKRNPIASVVVRAAATRVAAAAGVLLDGVARHEHERAAGAWHAEWASLREALACTGGAATELRAALEGLEVRPDRMRENLDRTGGLLLAERVTMALARQVGRTAAQAHVRAAAERVAGSGRTLREELRADPGVRARLDDAALDAALDPARALGAAGALVDRALDLHRKEPRP